MNLTGGIVLYAVIWFMVFFMVLPLRLVTQGEAGAVTPGTPEGAPHVAGVKRKAIITTVVAAILWVIIATIIITGAITVRDFDWRNLMPPVSS